MSKHSAMRPLSVGLSLSLAGLLVGCSGSNGSSSGDGNQGVTLVFGNWQFTDPGRGAALWSAVKKFEDDHPDITLKQEKAPSSAWVNKINTEIAGGKGPDVLVMLTNQFFQLVSDGGLLPLEDKMFSGADLNGTNKRGVVDGKRYGVTWEAAPYGLIWNKELLKKAGINHPPTTTDELIKDARIIHKKTGAVGFAERHRMSDVTGWMVDYNMWTLGHGAQWSDGKKLTIDSPENITALKDYKKVYDADIIPKSDDASTFRSKFQQGNLAFMMDNSGTTLTVSGSGNLSSKSYGVGPLPFPDKTVPMQQFFVGLNKNSENPEAAKKFIAWLFAPAAQKALRKAQGAETLGTNVPVSEAFKKKNPWAEAFLKQGQDAKNVSIPGFETQTSEIMKIIMQKIQECLIKDISPASALKQAQQEAVASVG